MIMLRFPGNRGIRCTSSGPADADRAPQPTDSLMRTIAEAFGCRARRKCNAPMQSKLHPIH